MRYILLFSLITAISAGFYLKTTCLIQPTSRYLEETETDEEIEDGEGVHPLRPGDERRDFTGRLGHYEEEEDEEGKGHRISQGHVNAGSAHWQSHRGQGHVDEEGEIDDRKRRQADTLVASHGSLTGKLTCSPEEMIHVLNVTVGYTLGHDCQQALSGCQAGSNKANQVLNCQGVTGSCDVTVQRNFLLRCNQLVNFAVVSYECVPATKKINICSKTDMDINGSVTVTSPNYPARPTQLTTIGGVVACECTLRAENGVYFEMEYLRTHLPGSAGHCDGDMLLIERPDEQGRYTLEHEICGHNVSNNVVTKDNILRLTLVGGSPLYESRSGFIIKFTAPSLTNTPTLLHISCTDSNSTTLVTLKQGTVSVNPTQTSPAKAQSQGHLSQGFSGQQAESEADTDGQSSPGVLSGVVAALASVIVIMGSVTVYIIHKRKQRRRRKKEELERYGTYQDQQWYSGGNESTRTTTHIDNNQSDTYAAYSLQNLLSKVIVLGREIMSSKGAVASNDNSNDHTTANSSTECPSQSDTRRSSVQGLQGTVSKFTVSGIPLPTLKTEVSNRPLPIHETKTLSAPQRTKRKECPARDLILSPCKNAYHSVNIETDSESKDQANVTVEGYDNNEETYDVIDEDHYSTIAEVHSGPNDAI